MCVKLPDSATALYPVSFEKQYGGIFPKQYGKMDLDRYRARYMIDADRPPSFREDGTLQVFARVGTITELDGVLVIQDGWDSFQFRETEDPHGMPCNSTWGRSISKLGEPYFLKNIFCCKVAGGFLRTIDHFQDLTCVNDERIEMLHTGCRLCNWYSSEGRIDCLSAADLAAVLQEKPEHTAQCGEGEFIRFFFDLARSKHPPSSGSDQSFHSDSRPAGLPHEQLMSARHELYE